MVLEEVVNSPNRERDELDLLVLSPTNAIDNAKIEMKHMNDMVMAYITTAFEENAAMKYVNKCKPSDWTNWLAWRLLKS